MQPGDGAKPVLLALQGGASLGAYTSGVLDGLLAEERLEIEGISGASAGAINGALLCFGMLEGGRAGARELLEKFWYRLAEACRLRHRRWYSFASLLRRSSNDAASVSALHKLMGRLVASFEMDPRTMDPLRQVLDELIDFERLRAGRKPKLFVDATDLRSNQPRIFGPEEISVEAILASACVPFLFEPVAIDGEYYWDGAFIGNPAIYPLIYGCEGSDVVLVQTSPFTVAEPPRTASQILARMVQVSSTSSLMRELRAIDFVSELVADGAVRRPGLREIRMHLIPAHATLGGDENANFMNADRSYFSALRGRGQQAAAEWLRDTFDRIGESSTFELA